MEQSSPTAGRPAPSIPSVSIFWQISARGAVPPGDSVGPCQKLTDRIENQPECISARLARGNLPECISTRLLRELDDS